MLLGAIYNGGVRWLDDEAHLGRQWQVRCEKLSFKVLFGFVTISHFFYAEILADNMIGSGMVRPESIVHWLCHHLNA